MGATMNGEGEKKLMELSYDKEGKWQVLCSGKTTKELRSNWEPETTHQVAIVLRNGKQGSAYVDGQRVGDASCELKNTDSKGISHFYIGGDGGSAGSKEDVPVTATNVLLYNRPLDDNEIRVLNANKISIPKLTDLKKLAAGATGEGTARDGGHMAAALFAEADCCRCSFCLDCGGLPLLEECVASAWSTSSLPHHRRTHPW
ncbi:hypothetical protein ECC02_007757 [Trypanosoma cruzi]|uniref:Trans-sialidase C-terminal domain-containing protein n=1 Tax=Trypanosoma cruzi TaxID=5693 RepID=A0A7J6XZD8_TRYCR|nr:hypothetical protein ECC02_007757 [Trypanosoma cruzi]